MSFPLSSAIPKEVLPEVTKLLGPHGSWQTQGPGKLTVMDEAGRVRQIRDMLKRMEPLFSPAAH